MEKMAVGDFGRFKFMRIFRNGKIDKRYFDLHGEVVSIDGGNVVIRDNDNYEYPVLSKNISYFKRVKK